MKLKAVVIISQGKGFVNMKGIACKHCGEEISKYNTVYSVDGGYVHESCMEDYIEDMWDELNLVNKMQLLDIDTGIGTIGEIISCTKAEYEYEGKL